MKKLPYLICLFAVFGCGQQKPVHSKPSIEDSKHKRALTLFFYNIGIDTLPVELPLDYTSTFYGKEIDSTSAMLFPEDMRKMYFNKSLELLGIFKFDIDKNRLGLIARTQSNHATSIKLLFLDVEEDSVTNGIELGHYHGYAGNFEELKSWLFKDRSGLHLHALIWQRKVYDKSIDNPNDTTVETSEYYTLLDLSKPRIDTIFDRKEKLPKQYEQLLTVKQKK